MSSLVQRPLATGHSIESSTWLIGGVWGLAVVASSVPLLAANWIGPYRHDDVYITLTFARNIANGAGFVYNGGPPLLGTTTPLLALMVAGLGWLFPNVSLLALATGVSVVAWIASAWLLAACWIKLGGSHLGGAALALLLLTQLGSAALLGMEAALFQFLLVVTIYLYLMDLPGWSGLSLGLLFLTRGEGVLLGPILVLWNWWTKKQTPWKLISVAGVVLLAWGLYGFGTFGTFLPGTLGAKIAQRESGLWRPFGERLFKEWLPGWFTAFPAYGILICFLVVGLAYAVLQRREWLMFLAWGMSYLGGYLLINPAGYWWYASPIFFVLNLFTALGAAALSSMVQRMFGKWKLTNGASVIASVIVVLVAVDNVFLIRHSLASYAAGADPNSNTSYYLGYVEASQWFMDHTRPGETIAYVEAGYLGYYTRNRVIDLTGLLTPGVSDHIRARELTWGFLHYQPDYVVIVPEFDWIMGAVRQLPEFKQSYQLVHQVARPGRESLSIYARADSSYLRVR
jgi:arabinofuranosyltransferase